MRGQRSASSAAEHDEQDEQEMQRDDEVGATRLLVWLNRREQLLEILLLRRDRLRRSRQLEEHAAARAFDDRADQTIAGHRFRPAIIGPPMPVYVPDVSITVIGTPRPVRLSILAVAGLPSAPEHLAFPALDVGLDAAALSGPE